jgi:translation initiation factor IF-2
MLEPKFVEEYMGTVEIRMVFNLTKYGLVAGSHCTDGKIQRNAKVRVKRDKDIVYEGKVASLKHVKEDVREITAGFDCGVQLDGWNGFKQGDVIEAFELVQVN